MRYFCIIYMLPKSKSGEKCHNFVHNEHLTLHKLGNSEKMLNFAFKNACHKIATIAEMAK